MARNRLQLTLNIILALAVITVIGGYAFLKTEALFHGPEITLTSPTNGQSVDDSFVKIQGTAKRVSALYINNSKVLFDQDGVFSEKFALADGYNIFQVRAEDRFGREISEKLELVYNLPPILASSVLGTTTAGIQTATSSEDMIRSDESPI